MALKSTMFSRAAIDVAKISEDVEELRNLSDEQRRALAEFLGSDENLITKDEVLGQHLVDFLRNNKISANAFADARRVCLFLVNGIGEYGDTTDTLFSDLAEVVALGRPGDGGSFTVYDFFSGMLPSIQRSFEEKRRMSAITRGMPDLLGLTYSCDVRMVAKKHFDSLEDKIRDYRPDPVEWIAVGIITTSASDNKEFSFQVDLQRLESALEVLQALRLDMVEVEKRLRDAGLPAVHRSGFESKHGKDK